MKYSTIRNQIKTGDILAWTHRSWSSWYDFKIQMIRLFTQSEYAHEGLAVVFGGRVWVLEAVTPLVRLVPLSNLLPCYLVPHDELTEDQLEKALTLVGNYEYSQLEAIKAYFNKNDRLDKHIQCAELVNTIKNLPCKDTPSATVQYLLQNGSTLMEIQP